MRSSRACVLCRALHVTTTRTGDRRDIAPLIRGVRSRPVALARLQVGRPRPRAPPADGRAMRRRAAALLLCAACVLVAARGLYAHGDHANASDGAATDAADLGGRNATGHAVLAGGGVSLKWALNTAEQSVTFYAKASEPSLCVHAHADHASTRKALAARTSPARVACRLTRKRLFARVARSAVGIALGTGMVDSTAYVAWLDGHGAGSVVSYWMSGAPLAPSAARQRQGCLALVAIRRRRFRAADVGARRPARRPRAAHRRGAA